MSKFAYKKYTIKSLISKYEDEKAVRALLIEKGFRGNVRRYYSALSASWADPINLRFEELLAIAKIFNVSIIDLHNPKLKKKTSQVA